MDTFKRRVITGIFCAVAAAAFFLSLSSVII
jgi:hypothetical protein